ncbi:MAG: glycogen synthase GlgA [Clostridiales bacterium]|nr:glycogen synthase GlgA [Clostridiales bacterium]
MENDNNQLKTKKARPKKEKTPVASAAAAATKARQKKEKTPASEVIENAMKKAAEVNDARGEGALELAEIKSDGLKILFAASEAGPFIRSGGLGDVAASLPKALRKNGNDIRVVLPLYLDIDFNLRAKLRYVGSVYVPLSWRRQYCGVFEARHEGLTYYFVDNEYYFKRSGIYGHFDDAERFAFFSKAILEIMPLIGFYPDILHVNDWQTALTPVFLDVFYRFGQYTAIKTVFTIHNIEFQGKYGLDLGGDIIGVDKNALKLVEYDKCVNFMKGAIESANAVTTVSETYAKEILDPFYSYGLEGILKSRKYKLSGIVNGIDVEEYNPETDKALLKQYNFDSIDDRRENKKSLLEMLRLPYDANRPLIGMVTRLTSQKGMDLVSRVAEDILGKDMSMVVLGKGDWKYENMLKDLESYYPNKLKAIIGFSLDVASKIYGSADFLLMPSKFEPCGLSQMIAMRYGAVPIVREAGGLKDTVEAYNHITGKGNGFTFKSYDPYDMLDAINRAFDVYYDKDEMKKVIANAMASDFSWEESARKYENLYRGLLTR